MSIALKYHFAGTSSVFPRPPDRKKLDKSVEAIGRAITDKETSLVSLPQLIKSCEITSYRMSR